MEKRKRRFIEVVGAIVVIGGLGFSVSQINKVTKSSEVTDHENVREVFESDDGKAEEPQPLVHKSDETLIELSFAHVVPGEYSEIYISIKTTPGNDVESHLSGPAVSGNPDRVITADENGVAHFTYKITQFGTYTSNVQIEQQNWSWADAITVE